MPKHVLIADDDEDIRRVIRWLIESRTTWAVCGEAVNGIDAIEKARTLNPDLILLDYSMPVMNGIETGAVLQAMLPGVPIILFIGEEAGAIESAAISVGIRAVARKTDIGGSPDISGACSIVNHYIVMQVQESLSILDSDSPQEI